MALNALGNSFLPVRKSVGLKGLIVMCLCCVADNMKFVHQQQMDGLLQFKQWDGDRARCPPIYAPVCCSMPKCNSPLVRGQWSILRITVNLVPKNCANMFLSEVCQIFANFEVKFLPILIILGRKMAGARG